MKYSFLLIIVFFGLSSRDSFGRQSDKEIDSLYSLVQNAAEPMDIANHTFQFIADFRRIDKDSALVMAIENLRLIETLDDLGFQARAYHQLGLIYRSLYEFENAYENYKKAKELSKEAGDDLLYGDVINSHAFALGAEDRYREAITLRLQSKQVFLKINNIEELAFTYYNMGYDYKQLDVLDSAEFYLRRCIELAEENNLLNEIFAGFNLLGNLYSERGKLSESIELYQKALSAAKEANDLEDIGDALNNMAISHKRIGDWEKAASYYQQSIAVKEQLKSDYVHFTYFNLGILYADQGVDEEALKYIKKALKIREKIGSKRYQLTAASMLLSLFDQLGEKDSSDYYVAYSEQLLPHVEAVFSRSEALTQLGLHNEKEGKLDLAERQYLEAYNSYKELGYDDYTMSTAEVLYEFYKNKKDYKNSLKFLEEQRQLQDSIVNEEQIREITRLDEQYKSEQAIQQKQNEIKSLEAKEKLASLQTQIIMVAAIAIFVIGFLIARGRIRSRTERAKKLEEIGEFKEAMTGMIAHDLKNPLSLILSNSSEMESTKYSARQMLQLINNLLDVQKFESTDVKLEKTDFNFHQLVIHIGGLLTPLLHEKNIKLELNTIDSQMVSADREMTERILINLLTNAIKFSPLNGMVTVETIAENGRVMISVSDQGPGISKEKVNSIFESFGQVEARKSGGVASTGLGLTFCKLAIKAHGSNIQVHSKEGAGTTFSFGLEEGKGEILTHNREIEKTHVFSISEDERANILSKIPALKSMKLYEVGEIKETLMDIKQHLNDQQAIDQWVESVLDAAYAGNEEEYTRLLEDF